jgi:mannose-6-phosphate isomerase-like protein (cupin superfamily)
MKKSATVLFISILMPTIAADPPDFAHWRTSEMRGYSAKLSPKINEQKFAVERLGNYGNHSVIVVHREGNGEAEVHQSLTDIFIVQNGEATLVVGGKVAGGRSTGPGEIRGASIEGGEKKKLGPGDLAHIPANTPHQVLLEPGRQFTYLIVKVNM